MICAICKSAKFGCCSVSSKTCHPDVLGKWMTVLERRSRLAFDLTGHRVEIMRIDWRNLSENYCPPLNMPYAQEGH
jgi:hypothetical protein